MPNLESFGQVPDHPPRIPEHIQAPATPEIRKTYETAHEFLGALDTLEGFSRVQDQQSLLKDLKEDHLIVRREDPDKILDLLTKDEPIQISFVGGSPYANSVEWSPSLGSRGLDNAFLEGYSHKENVVLVYGFSKPKDFYVEKLDDSQRVFNGVDRSLVRATSGYVPIDAIQFVTVRIPMKALPEEELTEQELDQVYENEVADPSKRKPLFAYRTYVRSSKPETLQ